MSIQKRRGYSVNVFLPDGDPEGIRVVEKSNWSGRGLVMPKAIFGENKSRAEIVRTGVYRLVGPSETSALPTVYVGEGDPIRPRLEQHARNKELWSHAVVFTSKDTNLNKSRVQWLQSRHVALSSRAKRCVLDNGTAPAPRSLSEADEAMAKGFLDVLLLCLPILGHSVFESGVAVVTRDADEPLHLASNGIEAHGQETAAGFVVLENSKAVGNDKLTPSLLAYFSHVKVLRDELIRHGVTVPSGGHFVFTQDYVFGSPSTAATVLMCRSANGRVDWKTQDGRTLRGLQEAEAVA